MSTLGDLIKSTYQETIKEGPWPDELKRSLRAHERIPAFFGNLHKEFDKPGLNLKRETVVMAVRDMTMLFVAAVHRKAEERIMSPLKKAQLLEKNREKRNSAKSWTQSKMRGLNVSPKTKRVTRPSDKSSKSPKSLRSELKRSKLQKRKIDTIGDGWAPGNVPVYDPKFCGEIIEFARKPEGHFKAFAASIGVTSDCIHKWADKYPEFKQAKAIAKEVNEAAMMKLGIDGMQGRFRPGAWQGAWIFAMKARFGLRDEPQEQDDSEVEFDFED